MAKTLKKQDKKVSSKPVKKRAEKPSKKPAVVVAKAKKSPQTLQATSVKSPKAVKTENEISLQKQALVEAKKTAKTKKQEILDENMSKLAKKWMSLYRKAENEKTPVYSMKGVYEEKSGLQHKLLGWGYVLSNKNDRLEVLFKDGVRYLISNYQG